MKKIIQFVLIIIVAFLCFSFTDKIIDKIKKKDPIMIEILKNKSLLETDPVNALIKDNYIIAGLAGTEIDINKSYSQMRKVKEYNENLFVFVDNYPDFGLENSFDKFIISGNLYEKEIALVFKVNDLKYINEVLYLLEKEKVKANFFIDGQLMENNILLLQKISLDGHFLGNLGYNNNYEKTTIKYTNSLINRFKKYEHNYCYVEKDDYNVLKLCEKLKMHTIKSIVIESATPYQDFKKNINNGGIYTLELNMYTLKELNIIINYIKQKGYSLLTIDDLLSE